MAETLIVDSWPVLEWLREREPARTEFLEFLNKADRGEVVLQMSRIIRGDIWYQVARRWGLDIYPQYQARIATLPVQIVSLDDALVDEAAELTRDSRYLMRIALPLRLLYEWVRQC